MHKLASTPITLDCFEIDDYIPELTYYTSNQTIQCGPSDDVINMCVNVNVDSVATFIVSQLEKIRLKYLETEDKRYWKELIRWLPESWLQKRTITMSYENLLAMCSKGQRRGHKLNEWSGKDNREVENFIHWARTLPYAQELIFNDELNIKPVDALSYYGIQLYNPDGTARTLDEIQSDIIKAKLLANAETSPLDN